MFRHQCGSIGRKLLLTAVSSFVVSICVFNGSTALAQDIAIEEIIVTASKTGVTSLQETPISITVFSESDIKRRVIKGLSDIAINTPGLEFSQNEQYVRLFMRGIGSSLDFLGSDPSTTVHIDGVYIARPVALFAELFDVERIEALRGPQGTLYGRNSVGGTVNIISRLPTDEPDTRLGLEYGTANQVRLEGSAMGPIIEGRLRGGVTFTSTHNDGYVKNLNSSAKDGAPENVFSQDSSMVRGVLQWLPSESVTATLRADYSNIGGMPSLFRTVNPGAFPHTPDGGDWPYISDSETIDLNAFPISEIENSGISGEIIWDTSSGVRLSSLTSYRQQDFYAMNDIDGTPGAILECCGPENSDQFSQELQLNSSPDSKLKWLIGLFYFEEGGFFELTVFDDRVAPTFEVRNPVSVDAEAYAVFAQASYPISDAFSLTAGIRYSDESKKIDGSFDGVTQQEKVSYDATTPKLGLDFQLNDSTLLYASVTKGFKSGGFNSTLLQEPFDPEFVWSYEAGLKTDMLNDRLRLNIGAFYYDYTDLQVQNFRTSSVVISNAADAKLQGIELELFARPSSKLDLNLGVSYLDATFENYIAASVFEIPDAVPNPDGSFSVDVGGNRLPSTPELSVNAGVQYTNSISDAGELSFRADYIWQDKVYFTQFNEDRLAQDAYGLLNARIAYTTKDEHWTVALFGKNMTDEVYYSGLFELPFASVDDVWGQATPPRTLGIQVTYMN